MRSSGQGRSQSHSGDALCKFFVGNVNKSTSDEDFRAYFEKFGALKDIVLMKDLNNPSQNRGFGFVTPETPDITDKILLAPNHQLDGRDLDIKRALPKEIDDPLLHVRTPRVFIGGLPHNISEEELTNFFNERYGELGSVTEVIIKKDRQSGKPRGFGFISFDKDHVVDKLLIENRFPVINNKRCEIRKADPGVPMAGAPPSQIQKYSSKNSTAPYPESRGSMMRNRMGGSHQGPMGGGPSFMHMGHVHNQGAHYGSHVPPAVPPMNSGNGYGHANYGHGSAAGVVGYPSSNAYYNYYHNQQGMGSYPATQGTQQQQQQTAQGQNSYVGMQPDPRHAKATYVKANSAPVAMPRGRPY